MSEPKKGKFMYQKTLEILKKKDVVTQEEAENKGIYFFRQRVHYLRQKGYDIERTGYRTYSLQT